MFKLVKKLIVAEKKINDLEQLLQEAKEAKNKIVGELLRHQG